MTGKAGNNSSVNQKKNEFQSLAGFQKILRPGRVLERDPITMECERHCISTKTNEKNQGKRPRKNPYFEEAAGQ